MSRSASYRRAGLVALLLAASPAGVHAAAITDNLLAWWDFESIGPGNTIADLSGNGRNLTLAANPYQSGGSLPTLGAGLGGGLALQSAPTVVLPVYDPQAAGGIAVLPDPDPDSPVAIYNPIIDANPEPTDLNNVPIGFGMQAWINLDNTNTHQTIFYNRDTGTGSSQARPGWELTLFDHDGGPGANHQLQFEASGTGVGSYSVGASLTVGINAWHHVVFTSGNLYFDGILIASGFPNPGFTPSAHDLFLGAADYAIFGSIPLWNQPLQGRMDKVAIWDRTISAAEVALLYNQGNGYNLPLDESVPSPGALSLMLLGCATLFAANKRRAI